MFCNRFKNFIYTALATLSALSCCVAVRMNTVSKFSTLKGEHTYYVNSASSQSLQKQTLSISDLFLVKGESVCMDKNSYEGGRYASNDDLAKDFAKKFDVEWRFSERVGDTVSYYGYTPKWQEKLFLYGMPINFHLAISQTQVVVGTPIIFGGF